MVYIKNGKLVLTIKKVAQHIFDRFGMFYCLKQRTKVHHCGYLSAIKGRIYGLLLHYNHVAINVPLAMVLLVPVKR